MRSYLLLCIVTIINAQKFDHYFKDHILQTELFLKYGQKQIDIFSQKDTLNIINTLKKDLKVLNEGTYIYGSYLSNIGYFALQKNKFDEARSYLKQAILHNKKFPSLLGIDFHNHSVLHIKESRIDSALIYHKLSLLVYDDALYAHLDQCEDFQKLDEKTLSRFLAIDNEAFDPKSSALYDKAMLLKDKGKTKNYKNTQRGTQS